MAGVDKSNDSVLAAQGAKAREDLNRRVQTNLDLGRLIRFQPSYRPATGTWNLIMACLGAVILIAIVVVNVFF